MCWGIIFSFNVVQSYSFGYIFLFLRTVDSTELRQSLAPSFRYKYVDKDRGQSTDGPVEDKQGEGTKLGEDQGHALHQHKHCDGPGRNGGQMFCVKCVKCVNM